MGRARFSVTAALLGVLWGPAAGLAAQFFDFRVEAAYTYDDNVTRSAGAGNVLSDRFFTLSLNAGKNFRLGQHTRLVAGLFLGGDGYDKYDGLSRYFGGIQGELQYRASGEFDAATFGLFLKGSRDQYDSELRDGYRYTAGVRVLKPLSDRFDLFAALAYNKRDGKSKVFDTQDYSARVNLDYAVARGSTVYFGAEYRYGDVVSTSPASLPLITIAEAVVVDDVFTDTQRLDYRIKADTVITTLGYNLAFGERHSLDFSWRWVQSTATEAPAFGTTGKPEYKVNQYSIAYLFRF
jgi:hypothetical protein